MKNWLVKVDYLASSSSVQIYINPTVADQISFSSQIYFIEKLTVFLQIKSWKIYQFHGSHLVRGKRSIYLEEYETLNEAHFYYKIQKNSNFPSRSWVNMKQVLIVESGYSGIQVILISNTLLLIESSSVIRIKLEKQLRMTYMSIQ